MTILTCKQCKHGNKVETWVVTGCQVIDWVCKRSCSVERSINIVTGDKVIIERGKVLDCDVERELVTPLITIITFGLIKKDLCGKEGKYFEEY